MADDTMWPYSVLDVQGHPRPPGRPRGSLHRPAPSRFTASSSPPRGPRGSLSREPALAVAAEPALQRWVGLHRGTNILQRQIVLGRRDLRIERRSSICVRPSRPPHAPVDQPVRSLGSQPGGSEFEPRSEHQLGNVAERQKQQTVNLPQVGLTPTVPSTTGMRLDRSRRRPDKAVQAGSTPAIPTISLARSSTGGAPGSEPGGWRFDPFRANHP